MALGTDTNRYFVNQHTLEVFDGEYAFAEDVNGLIRKTNLACDKIQAEVDGLLGNINYAQRWASAPQGVRPLPTSVYFSALAYALEARDWAERDQGLPIRIADGSESPAFSAKTWALRSSSSALAAGVSEGNAADSQSQSAVAALNSADSAALSQEFAEKDEDLEVQGHPGMFSSKHYSLKAAASAAVFDEDIIVNQDSPSGSAEIPTGTEAQRTSSPVGGNLRFNNETKLYEGYDGSFWKQMDWKRKMNLFPNQDLLSAQKRIPYDHDIGTGGPGDVYGGFTMDCVPAHTQNMVKHTIAIEEDTPMITDPRHAAQSIYGLGGTPVALKVTHTGGPDRRQSTSMSGFADFSFNFFNVLDQMVSTEYTFGVWIYSPEMASRPVGWTYEMRYIVRLLDEIHEQCRSHGGTLVTVGNLQIANPGTGWGYYKVSFTIPSINLAPGSLQKHLSIEIRTAEGEYPDNADQMADGVDYNILFTTPALTIGTEEAPPLYFSDKETVENRCRGILTILPSSRASTGTGVNYGADNALASFPYSTVMSGSLDPFISAKLLDPANHRLYSNINSIPDDLVVWAGTNEKSGVTFRVTRAGLTQGSPILLKKEPDNGKNVMYIAARS